MKCTCGARSFVDVKYSDTRRHIDNEMGQYTRRRFCAACTATRVTVEIDASELASLRRRAHLWEMNQLRTATCPA